MAIRNVALLALGGLLAWSLPADGRDAGYRPAGRRDPFVDPGGARPGAKACPAKGLAGQTIDSVALRGIVRGPGGAAALLVGPGGVGLVGRSGDRLCDGTLVSISAQAVHFVRDADPLDSAVHRVTKALHEE